MSHESLPSSAQNAEDVVLWRALRGVEKGRYVEVGANDPVESSISRLFYDRGWHGLEIEPVPAFATRFARERPRDVVVQMAVTDEPVDEVVLHVFPDTGLSTMSDGVGARHQASGFNGEDVRVPAARLDSILAEHGFAEGDVHFLVVDVEGLEAAVLRSVDLRTWRPWVLVIEATAPMTTEPSHEEWEDGVLAAGYEFCLFDGLSRFYVAAEHSAVLAARLGRPATVLDNFTTLKERRLEARVLEGAARCEGLARDLELQDEELIRLRTQLIRGWAQSLSDRVAHGGAGSGREIARLQDEIRALRATVSWRVTEPLRRVQARRLGTR